MSLGTRKEIDHFYYSNKSNSAKHTITMSENPHINAKHLYYELYSRILEYDPNLNKPQQWKHNTHVSIFHYNYYEIILIKTELR